MKWQDWQKFDLIDFSSKSKQKQPMKISPGTNFDLSYFFQWSKNFIGTSSPRIKAEPLLFEWGLFLMGTKIHRNMLYFIYKPPHPFIWKTHSQCKPWLVNSIYKLGLSIRRADSCQGLKVMKYPTTVPYSWGIRKTMRPLGLNDRLIYRILRISLICNKSTMYNITLLM